MCANLKPEENAPSLQLRDSSVECGEHRYYMLMPLFLSPISLSRSTKARSSRQWMEHQKKAHGLLQVRLT